MIEETGSFSIAPGEGQKPLPLLTDEKVEEMSNPDKFPLGHGGFNTERPVKLTHRKYVNVRLLSHDGRCARDVNYILGQQYALDHKQVLDCINLAMRNVHADLVPGGHVTAGLLKNPLFVKNLIKNDLAYRFLKNVRGSPPYWQTMFYETLAMIRTAGIPTWFLTLSAADLWWPEVIQTIAAQYGHDFTEEHIKQMSWQERCKWINQIPVTCARIFAHHVSSFNTMFMKSKAAPMGRVRHFVIRTEFQARGSPHVHTMFWIKDAPKLGCASDEEVIAYIDEFISCAMPADDIELMNLVQDLQVHSHSAACC